MPSSFKSHLTGRTLALGLVIVGVVGAMALFRAHSTSTGNWFSSPLGHFTLDSTAAPLSNSQIQPLVTLDQATEQIAERVAPAVVAVNVTSRATDNGDDDQNPLSQFFGPLGPGGGQGMVPRGPQFEHGVGSGVIISPDGLIVTNNHVIDGATDIQVTLHDKRVFPGKVVGADDLTDLALVKIDATGLPNLPWGDSKTLKQGDSVFAFGNPFGILDFTMTRGIVSGLGRPNLGRTSLRAPGDFIQTDAAINPGNSGGPLVNIHGDVVGINAFIYTSSGTFSGAGFAIPSELAKPTLDELAAKGRIDRGYLGISIEDMDPEKAAFFKVAPNQGGALISDVTEGSAADKAGLKPNDLIIAFNGTKIPDSGQLQIITGQNPPDTKVNLTIIRNGSQMTLPVTLGEPPKDDTTEATARTPAAPSIGVQLGITYSDLTASMRDQLQLPDDVKGVLVERVTPGGPADNANPPLDRDDVILEVDRVPVTTSDELKAQLQKIPPDKSLLVRYWRQGSAGYSIVHPASVSPGGH